MRMMDLELRTWYGAPGYFVLGAAHALVFWATISFLTPLVLIYYLSVGTRHCLLWHLALLGGFAGAVASNAFWLTDWVNYWWIRAPAQGEVPVLSHRTLRWLNVLVGLTLLVAPWPLGYPGAALANSVGVGMLLIALAPVGGRLRHSHGGGWPAVWRPSGPGVQG